MPMPWRMAAGRMASPGSALNWRPLGWTVIWKGPVGAVAAVMLWVSSGSVAGPSPILPSNQNPLGALPSRFRRQRVLVVGCGDVGLRVAGVLPHRVRVLGLTSSPARAPQLRARGITPLHGNLDDPATLARLAGLADRIVPLAPPSPDPAQHWWRDRRTEALLRVLRRRSAPAALVYA